jgi:hypothetical protein
MSWFGVAVADAIRHPGRVSAGSGQESFFFAPFFFSLSPSRYIALWGMGGLQSADRVTDEHTINSHPSAPKRRQNEPAREDESG